MTNMILWQEYLSSLPDAKFFYVMRMYLGEIKTPYNKTRLIEQLAAFLKKPENYKNLLSLIDEFDLKILTAVSLIPNLTKNKIADFFEDEYSLNEIYPKIANLTERLLIFPIDKKQFGEPFYKITPLFEDMILPLTNTELILPKKEKAVSSLDTPFTISPNFLTAVISYIRINGMSLKADGTFKKADFQRLQEIFGEKTETLRLIINSFINLSLVREGEKSLVVDDERWIAFTSQSELHQYILMCVSSSIRLGRETLSKQSQLLMDTLSSIGEDGFTRRVILRLGRMISSRLSENPEKKTLSRFSQMLSSLQEPDSFNQAESNLLSSSINSAIEFGLLHCIGKTENDEEIFISNESLFKNQGEIHQNIKVLNINAASSVTLLPGLPLKQLLPLTHFLQIQKCSTVTEFEITRKSVSKAFDDGFTMEEITRILSQNATFELPQNLLINLDEWQNTYSSAMLYKGYVLKVSKENIAITEKNPNIANHIKEKLAEGVYLLNIPLTINADDFLKTSGLDFMGSVKTATERYESLSLPELKSANVCTFENTKNDVQSLLEQNKVETEKIICELLKKLDAIEIDTNQKDSLKNRILNHIILSETQLVPSSVRTEILEASGIDFHGKIHLIEAAIKDEDFLEIEMPDAKGTGSFKLIGKPFQLIRHEGEAVLRMELEPEKDVESFMTSKLMHVKRIHS